ncbi:hypothetical protein SISNIDRAFT_410635 [Sistotremastrum niveocremeum HHB9708]|uniref:Nucleoside transporter n=1 Tax=Sistotremastrum niveocremeum HHB9708 TaxID=1314777 RepID=A0A164VG97_9AGAM|nr:hypothetical protein SISNIDRAFT_410635 [Sistotremastrum niveocremeum HHB9708]
MTTNLRRLSLETGYHAIPKAPLATHGARLNDEEIEQIDAETPHLEESLSSLPLPASVGWIYFILGAAFLLPWNAMITAMPYFLSRLANSPFDAAFGSYLSCSMNLATFSLMAHATITSNPAKSSPRIIKATLIITFLVFLLAVSTFFQTSPGLFFAFVIINALVQAGAGAYLQTAVFALASLFGSTAIQSTLAGQAAVGVVVSLVQVISAGGSLGTERSPTDEVDAFGLTRAERAAEDKSAFAFFSISTVFLLGSLIAHLRLTRTHQYQTIIIESRDKFLVEDVEERQGLFGGETQVREELGPERSTFLQMLWMNRVYNLSVAYVFVATLAVFPAITASITSVNSGSSSKWSHPLLFSSVHFLVFNIGDFVGRYGPSVPALNFTTPRTLATFSLARTLFIPLFLMCNIAPPRIPFFNSDFMFYFILLMFGVTNGYVSSLAVVSASSLHHNKNLHGRKQDVDMAATVASFCIIAGLVVGSFASFGVRAAVCGGCNPFIS